MAHYGTLRDYRFVQSGADADDIRGSKLYGLNDEKLGKIDDVIFDHGTGEIRYLVVDTGGWLSSKKFIVPADRIRTSAKPKDDFMIDLNQHQIEQFPPYDEKDVESEERWADYERKYRSKWETGPVMHRAETDRNITPTTAQMTQGTGATGPLSGSEGSVTPASSQPSETRAERIIPPTANDVTISSSAVGIGGRWDTFQNRLRQRRKEITMSCTTCSVGPASDRSIESVDRERKAI
jgi:sporulation protein YlmC with PRC-barrel domain